MRGWCINPTPRNSLPCLISVQSRLILCGYEKLFFTSTPAYPCLSWHYSPYTDSYIGSGESFTGLSNPGKTSGGNYACCGLCWVLENSSVWILPYKCGKNATLVAGLAGWQRLSSLLFSRLSTTFPVEVAQNRNVEKMMLI